MISLAGTLAGKNDILSQEKFMNKKRVITVIALIAMLAVAASVLAACDVYTWKSIGAGDSSANVVSNGGYYVEQGKYVYFINGYVGSVTSNNWGDAYKQSIMRAEKKEDGTIDNDTAQVVVPLSIYNEYSDGGIAVFGDWIYYATPNTNEDTTGTASTTYTDFMRTRTDGAVTQRIATVSSRSSKYLFTPTRIIYTTDSSTLNYVDFSGMDTGKSIDNGKGAKAGVLAENVSSFVWGYDADRGASETGTVSEYIFYTETITGDDSYRHYNNLCCIKYDGSDKRVLATFDSWFDEGDTIANNYDKVYTYSLLDLFYESDSTVTLYYTKSIYENGSDSEIGLYSNTFSTETGFSVENEKKLTESAPDAFYPLGEGRGILATKNSNVYLVTDDSKGYTDANLIIGAARSAKVQAVVGDYVYYTDSNGTALYRINLVKETGDSVNERAVIASGLKSDWLALEFVGTKIVWFNTDDYSYLYVTDLNDSADTGKMIGKMTQEDADAKAEAEKEEETAA